MKRNVFVEISVVVLLFDMLACCTQPHIIFMLIDDLGWNDVSFHGSPQIPTPNIDTLAFSGIILNNYYVQPLCTPSRGALMTGKYPIRIGLQNDVIYAGSPWGLSPKEIILPQHLKKIGYVTHGVGKWHLGYFKKDYLPINRGFDSYFGMYEGKGDYFTHFDIEGNRSGLDFHDNGKLAWNYTGHYSTEVFSDKSKSIIKSHNSSKPLFLFISHQAVHGGNYETPLQAPEEYIAKFSHIKNKKRRTFAAMVSALDKSVGEIFVALREKGMLENSIIVFTTDNGGAVGYMDKSSGSNWPLRGSKYNMWEGGVRGVAFIWSQLLPKSRKYISNDLMHITDWLPTLYAAAGGNITELGKIDGYNFWPVFNGNMSSPRDHILLNIDPVYKVEGIRKNQYKIIKGTLFSGYFDGWFDKEGNKKENVPFKVEELDKMHKVYKDQLHQSEVFKILMNKSENVQLFEYDQKSIIIQICSSVHNQLEVCKEIVKNHEETHFKNYMHYLSPPVEVLCGKKPDNASSNCNPKLEYCLFDVEKDPCEYNNLANVLPSVTEDLKKLLNKYRKQAVPPRNKPQDPNANPNLHGGAWIPWIEEETNSKFNMTKIKT